MKRFWKDLRHRSKWLLASLIGLVSWLFELLAGDVVTRQVESMLSRFHVAESVFTWSRAHPIGSVVVLAAAIVAAMAVQSYRETTKAGAPRIVPVRIYAEARSLIAVGAEAPHAGVFCACVNFRNDPARSHPNAEAGAVLAEIRFLHGGRCVLEVASARWGDTDQPAVRKATQPFSSLIDLNTVPFRIGETHELNIAIKHPTQAWFYAFNNSSYDFPNWENPAFCLTEKQYTVVVRLRSGYVDDEYRFVITNLGVGEGLELALHE